VISLKATGIFLMILIALFHDTYHFFLFVLITCRRQDVSHYFPLLAKHVQITLVEASDRILGAFDERMSKYAVTTLKDRGVKIQCGSAVTQITPEHVEMKVKAMSTVAEDGKLIPPTEPYSLVKMPYGSLVWAGGITSRPITKAIAAEIGTVSLALLHDCAYVSYNQTPQKTAFMSLTNVF
jgi:NADH dehydrogenase FAD-containing subunit